MPQAVRALRPLSMRSSGGHRSTAGSCHAFSGLHSLRARVEKGAGSYGSGGTCHLSLQLLSRQDYI